MLSVAAQLRKRFGWIASIAAAFLAIHVLLVTTAFAKSPHQGPRQTFPDDFLWGAASAGHQSEGYNDNSDWWEWEQQCHLAHCEKSGAAVDGYRRYEEDLDLAKGIGLNTYRMSIEWSRVEPQQGIFSEEEFAHYRAVLKAAHARGLKTMLTLQHFTLPLWVAHHAPAGHGSWLDPDISKFFAAYVVRAVREIGDDVDYWITINEPTVNMLTAYVVGVSPPGIKDIKRAPIVLANFLKAHALAYHIIHARYPKAKVSFAHHMRVFDPESPINPADGMIAGFLNDFWNHQFLRSIREGHIHFKIPFLVDYQEEFPAVKDTLDYIGVNYYTRDLVQFDALSPEKFHILTNKNGPKTDLGWEVYPHGLYRLLMDLKQYHLPVIITENGIADSRDQARAGYLCDHLRELRHAMNDGVDVRGYVHWSLTDNFEWSSGRAPRFGLVAVDYSTMQRSVRPSTGVFSDIALTGTLESCWVMGH